MSITEQTSRDPEARFWDRMAERYARKPVPDQQVYETKLAKTDSRLQPGDRVRLLIANNFSWRKNGAIEKFFRSRVQSEFFSHDFADDSSIRIVKNGMLTRKSHVQLMDKLKSTGEHFDDLTWDERKVPAADRQGTTMVLAIRHWFFEGFRELERR